MNNLRTITIASPTLGGGKVTITFDPSEFTDSAALHEALCQYDPGTEYSVTFSSEVALGKGEFLA
jgi:hypothetical protein